MGPLVVDAVALEEAVTITAIDNEGNQVIQTSAISFEADDRVADVLQEAAELAEVALDVQESEFGPFLNNIGDVVIPDSYYWSFYINGVEAQSGISEQTIANGDNVLFLLTDWPVDTVDVKVSALGGTCDTLFEADITLPKYATAYDGLVQASESVDATVDTEWLTSINNIDDYLLVEGDFWSFNVNGETASVGALGKSAEAGDVYEFRLDNFINADHIEMTCDSVEPDDSEDVDTPDEDIPVVDDDTTTESQDIKALRQQITTDMNVLANYILSKDKAENYGDEWWVWGLATAGVDIPANYLTDVEKKVAALQGDFESVSELEKVIIALSAMGEDVTDVAKVNLIEKLISHEQLTDNVSAAAFGLIALSSGDFVGTAETEKSLIDYLLSVELADGAWSYRGETASIDITGMVLTGLAHYQAQPDVALAIERAVAYLSNVQEENGGFVEFGSDSSETLSQVIIGLTSVGIDPTSEQFTKPGGNIVEHLLRFKTAEGLYTHEVGDDEANDLSIQQALLALAHLNKFAGLDVELDVTPQPDINVPEEEVIQEDKTDEDDVVDVGGDRLPDTASPYYNYLLIGLIVIVVGIIVFAIQRKRK